MPRHLLFDFFGTLVEYSASRTEQGYPRAFALLSRAGSRLDYRGFLDLWSAVAETFEIDATATQREFSMQAVSGAFLSEAIGAPPSATLVEEFIDVYLREWSKGVRPLPGVTSMISRLASRYRLAIVTNTHSLDLVPGHMRAMGIDVSIPIVVTSVGVGWRKPHRRIFEHALSQLGASPDDCLHIGDDLEADYRGARAAGLRALLIDADRSSPVADGDRIRSILDLEACLAGTVRDRCDTLSVCDASGQLDPDDGRS